MLGKLLILVILTRGSDSVIYSMNETEYNRMPPLYSLDGYSSCLLEPGGTYCVVDVDLFSDGESELMDIIRAYSEHTMKHFNHTQIHRGVCVTNKCQQFYHTNRTEDLSAVLVACLNDSIWRNYGIQAKLAEIRYCEKEGERLQLDIYDIGIAVVYLVLIVVNIVGSFYDIKKFQMDDKSGNPYLLAFSVRRHWVRLTSPSGSGDEPRLERLRVFHGMRTITMACVFFSHTVLTMAFSYVDNPLYIEKSYEDPMKQILFNGNLVILTFFIMSSFLLAYNFELYIEKHKVNWIQWPKGILLRWLRLTPTYALVLATISTWMRFTGSGPLWQLVVTSEATACRQWWWAHLLYINNYIYNDSYCALQTWYLAADTQLFCLGLLICVALRGSRARTVVLVLLFVIALITPAAHTYFQDLDAVVIQTPESYRSLYAVENTFRLLYIRSHTNLSTCAMGLAGGFLTYHWQNKDGDLKGIKKHRWVYWLAFPLGVAVILSGGLFYGNEGQPSTALRVLYATFYKPIFQLLLLILIIGSIFKFDSVYRCVMEWRGFTWMGRVSYSAFLLHTMFQRGLVGIQTAPIHMSDYYVMTILGATLFMAYIGGVGLWLCVEAPAAALTRAFLNPPRKTKEGEGQADVERSKM